LKMRDVRPVQINVRLGVRVGDDRPRQAAVAGLETHGVGDAELPVEGVQNVHGAAS
jgi:hypothetical protein